MPKGVYNGNKGKKLSEETKRKIGLNGFHFGMLGKHHSEEWRRLDGIKNNTREQLNEFLNSN